MFCRNFQSFVGSQSSEFCWCVVMSDEPKTLNPAMNLFAQIQPYMINFPTINSNNRGSYHKTTEHLKIRGETVSDTTARGPETTATARARSPSASRHDTARKTTTPTRAKQHRPARHCYQEHEANPSKDREEHGADQGERRY